MSSLSKVGGIIGLPVLLNNLLFLAEVSALCCNLPLDGVVWDRVAGREDRSIGLKGVGAPLSGVLG